MEAIFSQEQIAILQSKMWWVACNQTPFLIRSAILNNCILLTISDLNVLWATRVDQHKIMKDKGVYAKTLQVASVKQLIVLFQKILSNPEEKALYKFIKKNSGDLTFQIYKQIQVYPFQWKFQLIELDCKITQMMCKDIINPLVRTLNAQQKRFQIMRKKMEIMEKDLLKRMTETQKSYYKSALLQDQQDLKLLVSQPPQQQFITDLTMENRSKFFFQRAILGVKKIKDIPQKNNQKQKTGKVEKQKIALYNKQLNADEIMNQLQMKKQDQTLRNKKKIPRDFL